MLPATHQRLLTDAVEAAAPGLLPHLADLLRGNRDEDEYRWPLGFRTPALGFTHTCRPGSRFGELLFSSSRRSCARWLARASAARDSAARAECLGHAAHLLADAAVPARATGVWHLLGDPLETFVERRIDALLTEPIAPSPSCDSAGALVESLATHAARFPADTRAMPLSALRLWRPRVELDDGALEAQARTLVPLARAHLRRLLSLDESARAPQVHAS